MFNGTNESRSNALFKLNGGNFEFPPRLAVSPTGCIPVNPRTDRQDHGCLLRGFCQVLARNEALCLAGLRASVGDASVSKKSAARRKLDCSVHQIGEKLEGKRCQDRFLKNCNNDS